MALTFLIMVPGICVKMILVNGRSVHQLYKVNSNKNINLRACRLLLLSVIGPSIEYGSEVWEGKRESGRSFGIHNIRWSQVDGSLGVLLRPVTRQLEETWA